MTRSTSYIAQALALSLITAAAISAAPTAASAQQRAARSMAVLNIEAEGVDREMADTLTSIVRSEAQQTSEYQVVNSTPINLSEIVVLLGCDASSTACLGQAAQQLDAEVLIYGSVREEADLFRLRVEIFDARQQKITHRLQKTIPRDQDMIVAYRRELERFFRRLRQERRRATLVITSNVRGADVALNGEPAGTTPFERNDLDPGHYKIDVSREGFTSWQAELDLGEGAEMRLRAPLQKERVVTTPPDDGGDGGTDTQKNNTGDGGGADTVVELPDDDLDSETNWGGWSLVTVGALSLGGSGVLALLMENLEADLQRRYDDGTLTPQERTQLVQRGESYELSHRLLLGVGIAGVTVGGLWLLLDDGSPPSEDEEARRTSPRLELRASPLGVSGTVRW